MERAWTLVKILVTGAYDVRRSGQTRRRDLMKTDRRVTFHRSGAIEVACSATYANGGTGSCINGHCFATCDFGYAFDTKYNFCRPILQDLLNCGLIGRQCSIAHASKQACIGGICLAQVCVSGYTPSLDAKVCVLGASGRARAKRAEQTPQKTLCPAGETACPIAGSSSFHSVKARLSSTDLGALELLSAAGGCESTLSSSAPRLPMDDN